MTSRAATYIDYATTTPGNAVSAAPDAKTPASEQEKAFPGAFIADDDEQQGGAAAADLSRKPSVGIARDPVIRKAPADGDEEEAEEDVEDDGESSSRKFKGSSHRRSTSGAVTDSGYGGSVSNGGRRPASRGSQRSVGMEPIPILWTESPKGSAMREMLDDEGEDGERAVRNSSFKRASSLRSFRSVGRRASLADREERGSVRTTPSSGEGRRSELRRRRISLSGGSFASGAGTVGPASSATFDDAFHARSRSADLNLSEKQKIKLSKTQIKEGKKVAKIIKAEGKAEKKALDEALKELADLQKLQKAAVKEESKSYTSYSKAMKEFHKAELEFFAARAKYERAQADLQAHEDAREASRSHARETTEMLQEKNREVEWLRAQKAVDDREREAKVRQLTGKA